MVNPKEIRPGNYLILQTHDKQKLECVRFNQHLLSPDNEHLWERVKPIPLTTSALECMGFDVSRTLKQATLQCSNGYKLRLISGERYGDWSLESDPSVVLKYVHQLQNHYHKITGGEIDIKIPLQQLF